MFEYLQRMVKECRSEADYIQQFLPSPDNLENIEKMVDDIEGDLMRMAAEAHIVRHLVLLPQTVGAGAQQAAGRVR